MLRQLHRVRDLRRLTIAAKDGEIGKPEDLYFDDRAWSVRYLVVNTGGWLLGRRVLLAPQVIDSINDQKDTIEVDLTRDQIKTSPPFDSEKPISRQYELEYYKHFDWVPYWGAGIAAEPYPPPPRLIAKGLNEDQVPAEEIRQTGLRSSVEVTGYSIEAIDAEIGHVEDLVVDDQDWIVNFFEVDTRNWWPGKKVLVSRTWIDEINWLERKVRVNLNRSVIQSAPEYDPSDVISRDYELKLFEHYSKAGQNTGERKESHG
jgi:uncharacterized protein YrrD